jgi:hypothetical protein
MLSPKSPRSGLQSRDQVRLRIVLPQLVRSARKTASCIFDMEHRALDPAEVLFFAHSLRS